MKIKIKWKRNITCLLNHEWTMNNTRPIMSELGK